MTVRSIFALLAIVLAFQIAPSESAARGYSEKPEDYDLRHAEELFRSLQKERSEHSKRISELDRLIHKLTAENKEEHATQLTELKAQRSDFAAKLSSVEQRCRQAQQRVEIVKENINRARKRAKRLASEYARDGEREGQQYGSRHGDRDGRHDGAIQGRFQGEAIGIYRAKQIGIGEGEADGRIEGERAAIIEANASALSDGQSDGWASRGYDDGQAHAKSNTDRTLDDYLHGYSVGEERARKESFQSYDLGIKRADDQYSAAVLDSVVYSRESGENSFNNHPFSGAFVSLKKRVSGTIHGLGLQRTPQDDTRKSPMSVEPLPPYLDPPIPSEIIKIPHVRVKGCPSHWNMRYFNPHRVHFPTRDLQGLFERELRRRYIRYANEAYSHSYTDRYISSYEISASREIAHLSNPLLYSKITEESSREAKDYWFERTFNESFNSLYPVHYEETRKNSYAKSDQTQSIYQNNYAKGHSNALKKIGDQEGYKHNISTFKTSEENRGYEDRDKYYQHNAHIQRIQFSLEDANGDGIFAPNETFNLSIRFDNIGHAPPRSDQFNITLTVQDGNASVVSNNSPFPAASGRRSTELNHFISGKISSDARKGHLISLIANFYEYGKLLASKKFHMEVSTPLELGELSANSIVFVNELNKVSGTLSNNTNQPTPGPVIASLVDEKGFTLASSRIPSLQPNESAQFAIPFNLESSLLFSNMSPIIHFTSESVLQEMVGLGETFMALLGLACDFPLDLQGCSL